MNNIIYKDIDFILKSNVDWDRFRNKSVFITGAYGMLLSYMTLTLLRLNELDSKLNVRLIALIRDEKKAKKRFGHFIDSKYLKLIYNDLLSPIEIPDDIDFIIHGASYGSPQYWATSPFAIVAPNVMGTFHLLELANLKKIKSFLFFCCFFDFGRFLSYRTTCGPDTSSFRFFSHDCLLGYGCATMAL